MEDTLPITTLFIDIGGVLLTDGWNHVSRRRAATAFDLNWTEMEDRHRLVFETYEIGKLTLEEYLDQVVFHRKRSFDLEQFRDFMFAQSVTHPDMIELIAEIKHKYDLKIFVVSNESHDLNVYRIRAFELGKFVDCFVSSCFVGLRKPDVDIFWLALDLSQTPPQQIIYIDDTAMFVDIAAGLDIRGIVHTDYHSTREQLAAFGLSTDLDDAR